MPTIRPILNNNVRVNILTKQGVYVMKKILMIILALTMVAAFSGTVFAEMSVVATFGSDPTTGDNCTYGLSNNVFMDYDTANTGQDFALGAKHRSGNREFFTTNNTSLFYYFESDDYKGDTALNNTMPSPTDTSVNNGTPL